jgi:hypothetical protein
MKEFVVSIPDDLFEDLKGHLEEDLGETYVDGDDLTVMKDILKEGTLSMIIEDMEKLDKIEVVQLVGKPEGTQSGQLGEPEQQSV